MRLFFVALQFLTRIHIVKQDSWTAEDFGRSTRFFPLVGLVQGVIYLIFAWVLLALLGQSAFFASLMLILTIIITGVAGFIGSSLAKRILTFFSNIKHYYSYAN